MCGLFGLLCYGKRIDNLNEIIRELAYASAERGTDATGLAYVSNGRLKIYKKALSAYKLKYQLPKDVTCVVGHTRHATQGNKEYIANNHPFIGKVSGKIFALAHNGVLTNDHMLKSTYNLPKTKIETDSYVAVQLLERENKLNFDSLKFMAETVEGSFTFSIMDKSNNLYLVKGDSPLSILHFPKLKLYVYASTDNILWQALIESPLFDNVKSKDFEEISIKEGNILKIDNHGIISYGKFNYTMSFGCDWRNYGNYLGSGYYDYDGEYSLAYLDELKNLANYYGYTEDDIDELYQEGFTPDEIEEFLYDGAGTMC